MTNYLLWLFVAPPVLVGFLAGVALLGALRDLDAALESIELDPLVV